MIGILTYLKLKVNRILDKIAKLYILKTDKRRKMNSTATITISQPEAALSDNVLKSGLEDSFDITSMNLRFRYLRGGRFWIYVKNSYGQVVIGGQEVRINEENGFLRIELFELKYQTKEKLFFPGGEYKVFLRALTDEAGNFYTDQESAFKKTIPFRLTKEEAHQWSMKIHTSKMDDFEKRMTNIGNLILQYCVLPDDGSKKLLTLLPEVDPDKLDRGIKRTSEKIHSENRRYDAELWHRMSRSSASRDAELVSKPRALWNKFYRKYIKWFL